MCEYALCRRKILQRSADRFEERNLRTGAARGHLAPAEIVQIRLDLIRPDDASRKRQRKITPFGDRAFARIAEKPCAGYACIIRLAHVRREGAHAIEMRTRFQPAAVDEG
jgi:hypothetical protein